MPNNHSADLSRNPQRVGRLDPKIRFKSIRFRRAQELKCSGDPRKKPSDATNEKQLTIASRIPGPKPAEQEVYPEERATLSLYISDYYALPTPTTTLS